MIGRIQDGYERSGVVRGIHLHYRPATMRERDKILAVAKRFGEEVAAEAAMEFVTRHIVASDLGFSTSIDRIRALNETQPQSFNRIFALICGQIADSSGEVWGDVEHAYRQNLFHGIVFQEKYPELAKRSCDDCRKFWYRAESNQRILNSAGEPLLRPDPPACESGMGISCPKGHYANQKTLNNANKWTYAHWKECMATHSFPDDDLVKVAAQIIQKALVAVERLKSKKVA